MINESLVVCITCIVHVAHTTSEKHTGYTRYIMHGSKKGGKELVWEDKDVHAFNDGVNIQGDVCNIKIEPNHWEYCY